MQKPVKIVALGDSITYGYPYDPTASWVQLTADALHIAILNRGLNGDTTGGMRWRFTLDVLREAPTHVILLGGTNDVYERESLENALAYMTEMAEQAKKHNILPIIGLPIPCNDEWEEIKLVDYREALRQYARRQSLLLLDFYADMADEQGKLRNGLHGDGIHPNRVGYETMARTAVSVLRPLVSETL